MVIIDLAKEVKHDLEMAKKILKGLTDVSYRSDFNPYSFIYKTSNERTNEYESHLQNKERMISVIGSGDQILNAILLGTREVDAFDIGKFPKYFFLLKIAAIQALTLDEYIDFFYVDDYYKLGGLKRDLKYRHSFDKISKYLDPETCYFWTELLKRSSWHKVYNSKLFSDDVVRLKREIEKNRYLQLGWYNMLKGAINEPTIRFQTGDILDLASGYQNESDLVFLSNIKDYVDICRYIYIAKNFKLREYGEVLTYCFIPTPDERKIFIDQGFICEDLSREDALMIYRK